MNVSIEIATTCTWFQHRLCWMLSSVLLQRGDVPQITFSLGYPQDNGDPTTEEVVAFFRNQGLAIRELRYPDMEVIQYRGLVRNIQLHNSTADWILFADADMTYSPEFFEDLGRQLESELVGETGLISASRVSLHKDFCKDFFNLWDKHQYPCIVENAGELQDWPVFKQATANVGAGYFQLVNRKHILETYGRYVDPAECNDRSWKDGQKARSDQQFRHMVGSVRKITTLPQYHLNHSRDNEAGEHLTNQR